MRYSISPHDIQKLLDADWEDPNGAIYVCDDLSLAEANRSILFRNARTILNALNESGGTKATEAGNLNRKFVAEMLEKIDLTPRTVEIIRRANKVINEQDVWDLHLARIILELAGLIRKHRGMFKVIQKRSHLMEDENAGELYKLLFRTFFQEFNLAYLDRFAEAPLIQQAVAFSLFMVSRLMNQWEFVGDVAPFLLLEEMPVDAHSGNTAILVHCRIIRPLLQFGLLEGRQQDGSWSDTQFRKTDLFDRVLSFNVKVTTSDGYLH